MHSVNKAVALILCFSIAWTLAPGTARADKKSLASQTEIEKALQEALAKEAAARESIRSLLRRAEIRRLAEELGFDEVRLQKAELAVDTLEGPELERAAAYSIDLDKRLAGGHTVTISLVALLLIIIIVILLAD